MPQRNPWCVDGERDTIYSEYERTERCEREKGSTMYEYWLVYPCSMQCMGTSVVTKAAFEDQRRDVVRQKHNNSPLKHLMGPLCSQNL